MSDTETDIAVDGYLRRFAPDDVRAAIGWLGENGYELTQAETEKGAWFGHSLPSVLAWLGRQDVSEAVARAQDERHVTMWPDSHKAKQLRRTWRAQGLPAPDSAI